MGRAEGGSDEEGEGRVHYGLFRDVGGPQDRPLQAAPDAGHHCHCHLRRHLRRRFLGLHRIVRQEQAGMVSALSWNCPTASRPTTPSATVFSRLDPEQFQQCFMAWTQAVSDLIPGEVVAIDGKTVRRSHDRNSGQRAIHLVRRLGLGQHADPGAGEDRGEVQRNHRHPPVAANAGTAGVHRHYRRHGLPAGDRPGDSGSGSRLRAGAEGEPGSTV